MLTIGSLFTGGGGLDMAVKMLWPDARIAWTSEFDKAASKLLAARYLLSPNHGDITAIDWTQVEPVDVLVGGFPCQDISHAGKRAGITEETRSGLWFHFRDAIRHLRPRLVLVENVAAITAAGGGLDVVLGALAEIGFDAEWALLRASDVGAPHRRDRWFAVAWPADADVAGLEGRHSGGVRERGDERAAGPGDPHDLTMLPTPRSSRGASATETTYALGGDRTDEDRPQGRVLFPTPRSSDGPKGGPNQTGDGLQPAVRMLLSPTSNLGINGGSQHPDKRKAGGHGPTLADQIEHTLPTPTSADARGTRNATSGRTDPESAHHSGWTLNDVRHADRWGEYGPAIARWETILGRPAPDPTDDKGRLSPAFVEWMMGWPQGWVDLDGLSRANRLKILGNGVVPQQAAAAFGQLLGRVVDAQTAAA